MNNNDIIWITVNGVHIPIKKGQNKAEAIRERFSKNAKSDENIKNRQLDQQNKSKASLEKEDKRKHLDSKIKEMFPECNLDDEVLDKLDNELLMQDMEHLDGFIKKFTKDVGMNEEMARGLVSKISYSDEDDYFASMSINGKLVLTKMMDDTEQYDYTASTKFHPSGTTIKDVLVHEYGHVLVSDLYDSIAFDYGTGGRYKPPGTLEEFESSIFNSAALRVAKMKDPNATEPVSAGSISRYAKTDAGEAIAEGLCDYYANGNNAKRLSKEIYKELASYYDKFYYLYG